MNKIDTAEKMIIDKEEAKRLNNDVDKALTPRPMAEILNNRPQTREELYNKIQKWLYLQDTYRIDIILAVYITIKQKGNPLWVFFVGGSGDGKSELLRSLNGLQDIRPIDQLTANTFASGKPDASDLGSELQGKNTLLLFSDLACLTSLNKDEKKKIWSQFRTLYDGEIFKDTGSGVKKKYDDCNVSILACTTSAIKGEYHIHQQLGTRELLYDTEPDPRDNKKKMTQAMKNMGKKAEMRKEIREAVQGFLLDKKYDGTIELPKDVIDFIFTKCEKLRLLRASGTSTDWRTGELDTDIEAEVTTRLVQQFLKLYIALKSLDKDYPNERYREIIERFVKSSSNPVRYKLYEYLKKNQDDWFTVYDLHLQLKNSKISISSQCEALWNLGSLDKKYEEKMIGYEGSNRWKDVAHYKANISKQVKFP